VIRLTRINKTSLAMNADLIKFIETAPDTVITLSTGEKVVVTESVEQIIDLIVQFRRSVMQGLTCPALGLYLASTATPRVPYPKSDGIPESGRAL
jgi:flagellar protein FlbD